MLLLFGVRFTPVLPQWHVKDPCHSAKSAVDGFYLDAHTPSTQRSRSGLTMPLARHSEGTNPELRINDDSNRLIGAFILVFLNRCKAPRGCY